MYRRRRNNPFQTANLSFIVTGTKSFNGVGNVWNDGATVSIDTLTAGASLGTTMQIKRVDVASLAYSSDITITTLSNASPVQQVVSGAECWYIDAGQIGSIETSRLNTQVFLSNNQMGGAFSPDTFPRRIVYRRRFTLVAQNTTAGSDFGNINSGAAFQTPGFGTDRVIKRRITLGRQEVLYYRFEVYNINVSVTTNVSVKADVLAALTFAARG